MKSATERNDFRPLFELNRKFHFTVYQACRRPLLLELLNDLWDRSTRYRTIQTHDAQRVKEELGEHKDILEACHQENRKELPEAIRFNVQRSFERSLSNMDLSDA